MGGRDDEDHGSVATDVPGVGTQVEENIGCLLRRWVWPSLWVLGIVREYPPKSERLLANEWAMGKALVRALKMDREQEPESERFLFDALAMAMSLVRASGMIRE